MNSQSSSTSMSIARPPARSRLSFAISNAEEGEADTPNVVEHQIHEEIDEIKRYEVFS
jgi:hypothetical protein